MSWSYRQALPSHGGGHILPAPPDRFMALLGCPLEKKKRQIDQNGNQGLRPSPIFMTHCRWVSWRWTRSMPRRESRTPCLQRQLGRKKRNASWNAVLCKFSTTATLNLVKSSCSFRRRRLFPPWQPSGPACRWQRLRDDGRTAAVRPRLDSRLHEQIQSTALNITPDLLLHIQACYILQPAHQMLSG